METQKKILEVVMRMDDKLTAATSKMATQSSRNLDKVSKSAKKTNASLAAISKTALKMIGTIAGLAILRKATQWLEVAARGAAQFRQNLQSLATQLSTTTAGAKEFGLRLQETLNFEIALGDATTTANRAIALLGRDAIPQINKLADVALRASRVMGTTVTKAFNDLVVAIGRQSRLMLDNLGIIVSVEKAYGEYADQMGKLTSELTEAERRQAFMNAALTQGERKFGDIDIAASTAASRIAETEANIADLRGEIGDRFIPVLEDWLKIQKELLKIIAGPTWDEAKLFARLYNEELETLNDTMLETGMHTKDWHDMIQKGIREGVFDDYFNGVQSVEGALKDLDTQLMNSIAINRIAFSEFSMWGAMAAGAGAPQGGPKITTQPFYPTGLTKGMGQLSALGAGTFTELTQLIGLFESRQPTGAPSRVTPELMKKLAGDPGLLQAGISEWREIAAGVLGITVSEMMNINALLQPGVTPKGTKDDPIWVGTVGPRGTGALSFLEGFLGTRRRAGDPGIFGPGTALSLGGAASAKFFFGAFPPYIPGPEELTGLGFGLQRRMPGDFMLPPALGRRGFPPSFPGPAETSGMAFGLRRKQGRGGFMANLGADWQSLLAMGIGGFAGGGAGGAMQSILPAIGMMIPGLGPLGGAIGGLLGGLFGKKKRGETPSQPVYVRDPWLESRMTDLLNITKSMLTAGAGAGIAAIDRSLYLQAGRVGAT